MLWETASRLLRLRELEAETTTIPTLPPGFSSLILAQIRTAHIRQLPALCASTTSPDLEQLCVQGIEAVGPVSRAFDNLARFDGLQTLFLKFLDAAAEWEDIVPLLSCSRLDRVMSEVGTLRRF